MFAKSFKTAWVQNLFLVSHLVILVCMIGILLLNLGTDLDFSASYICRRSCLFSCDFNVYFIIIICLPAKNQGSDSSCNIDLFY